MISQKQREEDLKSLQDAIYRDKVLRARAMTPEQRLEEAFELTEEVFQRMLDGALADLGTRDAEEGWREVARRLQRLSRIHDRGLYVSEKPTGR